MTLNTRIIIAIVYILRYVNNNNKTLLNLYIRCYIDVSQILVLSVSFVVVLCQQFSAFFSIFILSKFLHLQCVCSS